MTTGRLGAQARAPGNPWEQPSINATRARKGRNSSWRVTWPDIVPGQARGSAVSARSAPPYYLCAGIRSARSGAILPHVPNRAAEIRPAVSARRHRQPPAGCARRRDRILDHRDRGKRLADPYPLRFSAMGRPDPARPCRADLAHGFPCDMDLLARRVQRYLRAILEGELALRDLHHLPAF